MYVLVHMQIKNFKFPMIVCLSKMNELQANAALSYSFAPSLTGRNLQNPMMSSNWLFSIPQRVSYGLDQANDLLYSTN